MKRNGTSLLVFCRKAVAVLFLAIVCACTVDWAHMDKQTAYGRTDVPDNDSVRQDGVRALAMANTFRLSASGGIDAAMKAHATDEYYTAWSAQNGLIDNQSFPWEDFYASAILFVGRISEGKAVAIFYNPWSDIAVLTGVDLAKGKLFEGFVVSGDTLRGDTLSPEKAMTPAWMREENSVAVALGKIYAPTEKSILRLFPPAASYELLPGRLAKRADAKEEEFAAFVVRELARTRMFDVFLSPDGDTQKALRGVVAKILSEVADGNRDAFSTSNIQEQRPEMTESIVGLPEEIRGRMSPNFLLEEEDGSVVALVNPAAPQWLITIHMKGAADALAVSSVEIFKFELLHLLN